MNIRQILTEATDFSTGEGVINSIKNNEAGVSAKNFFNVKLMGHKEIYTIDSALIKSKIELAKKVFDEIIRDCKTLNLDRTKVIKLILRRSENILNFNSNYKNLDPYLAYFKNRDKKEAKTTYKELFDKFANSKMISISDREFEKKVNELFADKTNIKDTSKEVNFIYPKDESGWEMLTPKTFAAAVKYSTTKEGKTHWCTAAQKHHFDYYNDKGSLYIIRNYDKNIAYQLFFLEVGPKKDELEIQLMDKNDLKPTKKDLNYLIKILPEKLLGKITIRGKSFLDIKNKINKEESTVNKKYKAVAPFKKENINGWSKESYHIRDEDDLKNFINFIGAEDDSIETLTKYFSGIDVRFSKETKTGQVDIYKKGNISYTIYFSKRKGYDYEGTVYRKEERGGGETLNQIRRVSFSEIPVELQKIISKGKTNFNSETQIVVNNKDFVVRKKEVPTFNMTVYTIAFNNPIIIEKRYDNSVTDPRSNKKENSGREIIIKADFLKIVIPKYRKNTDAYHRQKDFAPVKVAIRGYLDDELNAIWHTIDGTNLSSYTEADPLFFKSLEYIFPNLKSRLLKKALDINKRRYEEDEPFVNNISIKNDIKTVLKKVRDNIK